MRTNGGFQVSKIKQLGDRVFEKILASQGIEAFNGAQGRILYVLWQEDGVPIKTIVPLNSSLNCASKAAAPSVEAAIQL